MPGKIEGVVTCINDHGNLVTDISAEQLTTAPRDERVMISCEDHITNCIFTADHQEPATTLLALIGESGKLELTIVGENMSMMLGLGVGQRVTVKW